MTQRIGNPFPMFFDRRGLPLTGGSVFIGAGGSDPEDAPATVYADANLTIEVSQPIRTIGGMLVRDGVAVQIYVDGTQHSIRVRDADGAEVLYLANASLDSAIYQLASANLTALAAQASTPYGRGLLSRANPAALRTYAEIPDALPLAGGTMTGEIRRAGAGGYAFAADAALPRLRFFFTDLGDADPRTLPGDVWYEANE